MDVHAVWARTWLFVAVEAEVREAGDYVTVDVGPYSVIVVRDDDEIVNAFLNVCRHRGARILDERAGSVGNIVCGYHQWTYSPDGSLLHAGDQPPTFDKGCFGLKTVQVRVAAGRVAAARGRPAAHLRQGLLRPEAGAGPGRRRSGVRVPGPGPTRRLR